MNITEMFEKIDVPLNNPIWSWGSFCPVRSVVVLRVWEDGQKEINNKPHMMISYPQKDTDNERKLGYQERLSHIEAINAGAKCYMIMCLAKDAESSPREIESFNEKEIFIGGKVIEHERNTYIEIVDCCAVSKIT